MASDVISAVQQQLAGPAAGYSLRTTGHSLGAALSSIAAVSLKFNFPDVPVSHEYKFLQDCRNKTLNVVDSSNIPNYILCFALNSHLMTRCIRTVSRERGTQHMRRNVDDYTRYNEYTEYFH